MRSLQTAELGKRSRQVAQERERAEKEQKPNTSRRPINMRQRASERRGDAGDARPRRSAPLLSEVVPPSSASFAAPERGRGPGVDGAAWGGAGVRGAAGSERLKDSPSRTSPFPSPWTAGKIQFSAREHLLDGLRGVFGAWAHAAQAAHAGRRVSRAPTYPAPATSQAVARGARQCSARPRPAHVRFGKLNFGQAGRQARGGARRQGKAAWRRRPPGFLETPCLVGPSWTWLGAPVPSSSAPVTAPHRAASLISTAVLPHCAPGPAEAPLPSRRRSRARVGARPGRGRGPGPGRPRGPPTTALSGRPAGPAKLILMGVWRVAPRALRHCSVGLGLCGTSGEAGPASACSSRRPPPSP